jgi:hypothetical protein
VIALTVTAWCFAGAPAGSPSTAPSAEVQALIARLSDADWRVREKAQARLVEFGEEARGPLEKLAAADDATPDARGSARRALKLLDEAGLTGQTRVTLHFKDAHPRDVIAELARGGPSCRSGPKGVGRRRGASGRS